MDILSTPEVAVPKHQVRQRKKLRGFVSLTLSCKIGGHHNGNRSSLLGKGKNTSTKPTFAALMDGIDACRV